MILCYTCIYVNANILNNLINLCSYSATSGMCVSVSKGKSVWKGTTLIATGGGQSSGGRSGWGWGEAQGAGGLGVWMVYPVWEVEMKARNHFGIEGWGT